MRAALSQTPPPTHTHRPNPLALPRRPRPRPPSPEDRETALIGDIVLTDGPNRAGLFVPIAKGDIPNRDARGFQEALFMSGGGAEFGGQMIIPLYAPFNPGQPFIGGFVWQVQPFAEGPVKPEAVAPINYYLAGAAGVPNA